MPVAYGLHGAVVAPHHLATAIGRDILRAGGSAVDAAIATNAALAVVYGSACGIGGDAFWLIWDPRAGEEVGLNGSGRSAAAADAGALVRAGLAEAARCGAPSRSRCPGPCAPGAMRTTVSAGFRGPPCWPPRSSWRAMASPPGAASSRPSSGPRRSSATRSARTPPGSASTGPTAGRGVPASGSGCRPWPRPCSAWPTWAGTSSTRARRLSTRPVRWRRRERHRPGGPAPPHVHVDEPIATDYRGTTVTTHPPNSQGFVALEMLNVLARFEPPAPRVFAGGTGADLRWTHLGLEAAKLAMADRDAYLTDPAVSPTPLERLLSPGYAADLARRIDVAGRHDRTRDPPARRGHDLAGRRRRRGLRREPDRVQLHDLRLGRRGPGDRDRLPEPGLVLQPRSSAAPTCSGRPNEPSTR